MIFHLINQSYKKKITFVKRQAIAALITLNEKTNENFKMEVNYAPAEGIKKEKKTDGLIFNLQNYLLMLPY